MLGISLYQNLENNVFTGFKKADSRHSSVSSANAKTKTKDIIFEDELEDTFDDNNKT